MHLAAIIRRSRTALPRLAASAGLSAAILLGPATDGSAMIPTQGPTTCTAGMAGQFPCNAIDLGTWFDVADVGGGEGNDIWGWTDTGSGREFAIYGRTSGTSFIEVTNPSAPVYLGDLPRHDINSVWRDIKVHADHAYIVSESPNHGLQVFDLSGLLAVGSPPVTFSETTHLGSFGSAHNIFINETTAYAYVVGADQCAGGLTMIDLALPTAPVLEACYAADGYTHDVQCVIYAGPDGDHTGAEICFAYNEDTLTIVDVTTKNAPVQLSRTGYAGSSYTHQGWLTDDHAYLLLDDELDEDDNGHNTRTYIVDLADLDAPVFSGTYTSHLAAIDHNQYVVGDYVFQANYSAGLRILDISDIAQADLCEVASFDTFPANNAANFSGAWSVYPFFASGTVVVSAGEGMAVVLPSHVGAPCIPDPPIVQNKGQSACINSMNKSGAKVSKAQGKLIAKCVKDAGAGKVADADACIAADSGQKVAKAESKTGDTEAKRCEPANLPTFGYTSAAMTNAAASGGPLDLAGDLFGSPVDPAIADSGTQPTEAKCQAAIAKSTDKVYQTVQKAFLKCKKTGLKNGSINTPENLGACVSTAAADSKTTKAVDKLASSSTKSCGGVDLATAFPGACSAAGDFAACAGARAICRACMAASTIDAVAPDCDLADDGAANASCP